MISCALITDNDKNHGNVFISKYLVNVARARLYAHEFLHSSAFLMFFNVCVDMID